jgi:uncharacterized protein YoxC
MTENNLSLAVNIAEILLFLTLIIVGIYVVVFMKKFLKSISNIENEVVQIADELAPVINDMKYITDDVKEIVDKSRVQFDKIEDLTNEITDKGKHILNAIDKVQNAGSDILGNSFNIFSAIGRGVSTFKNKLVNGKESSANNSKKFFHKLNQ